MSDDIRLDTIREICRREGHGQLIDITTLGDYGRRAEYLCNRGCGVTILRLKEAHDIDEVCRRLGTEGTIRVRGDVEMWPAPQPSD